MDSSVNMIEFSINLGTFADHYCNRIDVSVTSKGNKKSDIKVDIFSICAVSAFILDSRTSL